MSSAKPARPLAADLISLAICSLIWGTTWRAIKLELGAVPPLQSVVYRFALASVVLFAWCASTGRPIALTRRQHVEVFGQGLCGFCLQYACVYQAEAKLASGAMAVIFAAVAFVNLVLFRLLLGQRASPLAWAGTLLGLGGVAAMSFAEILAARAQGAGFGVLIALAGVVTAVLGNLFAARAQSAGAAVAPGAAWAMGYGAGLLALFELVRGEPWRFDPTPAYVGGLLYLALLGSVVAFVVFYSLARRRGYTFASYVAALTPPTAMILSALTEGAHWGWAALAGLALVLGGQILLIRGREA